VNRRQKIAAIIGVLVAAALCLYPPRRDHYGRPGGIHYWYYFDGWAWAPNGDVAWGTLLAEVLWIAVLTGFVVWSCSGGPRSPDGTRRH
jgi:hypothetical protein